MAEERLAVVVRREEEARLQLEEVREEVRGERERRERAEAGLEVERAGRKDEGEDEGLGGEEGVLGEGGRGDLGAAQLRRLYEEARMDSRYLGTGCNVETLVYSIIEEAE